MLTMQVLADCRKALEEKLAELRSSRGAAKEGLVIEKHAEEMESAIAANDRDLAVRSLNRNASLQREVLEALERFETGEYGTCASCDEQMRPARLKAIPWAKRCVNCEETYQLAREHDSFEEEREAA